MALSLGKLIGAGVLGVSADKYGRRTIYAFGIVLFVIAGPASAYVPWYWGFVFLRLLTGICFSAIQFSSLTTREYNMLYIYERQKNLPLAIKSKVRNDSLYKMVY